VGSLAPGAAGIVLQQGRLRKRPNTFLDPDLFRRRLLRTTDSVEVAVSLVAPSSGFVGAALSRLQTRRLYSSYWPDVDPTLNLVMREKSLC